MKQRTITLTGKIIQKHFPEIKIPIEHMEELLNAYTDVHVHNVHLNLTHS